MNLKPEDPFKYYLMHDPKITHGKRSSKKKRQTSVVIFTNMRENADLQSDSFNELQLWF